MLLGLYYVGAKRWRSCSRPFNAARFIKDAFLTAYYYIKGKRSSVALKNNYSLVPLFLHEDLFQMQEQASLVQA